MKLSVKIWKSSDEKEKSGIQKDTPICKQGNPGYIIELSVLGRSGRLLKVHGHTYTEWTDCETHLAREVLDKTDQTQTAAQRIIDFYR